MFGTVKHGKTALKVFEMHSYKNSYSYVNFGGKYTKFEKCMTKKSAGDLTPVSFLSLSDFTLVAMTVLH